MTDITLLDGSIGQEIMKRSGDRPTPLWSTQVMIDHPGIVQQVHEDYFAAGATIATANSYAIHRDRLLVGGVDLADFPRLIDCALTEAEKAVGAAGGGRVAGALGPLTASYRPDISPPLEEAASLYAELVSMMAGRVDLLLIETASSVAQAEGALKGCEAADVPVWLSVSVRDDDGKHLRSGEPIEALAPVLDRYAPDAVLINCSRPEAITDGLGALSTLGRPFGAYANGFTHISDGFLRDAPTVDALEARVDMGPEDYAGFAMGWVAQGATIIGGCCEVGPAHIREIAQQLIHAGHKIV